MNPQDTNPYSPGAGHSPPYLAGREAEIEGFRHYLGQDEMLKNVILTGLRGTGKTVLMDNKYKQAAQSEGWVWVGSDFAESSFLRELTLCVRLLTDLSVFTSGLSISSSGGTLGFDTNQSKTRSLSYDFLIDHFKAQPGLTVDKLKSTLEFVWNVAEAKGVKGILFAYDEAQVVRDQKAKDEYPLAILLETFQSLQRKGARYLLLLTGLPTLFPKLVESRTYAERMFAVQELGRLTPEASRAAIELPLRDRRWKIAPAGVQEIIETSGGYPYFIQFICHDTFDRVMADPGNPTIPMDSIIRKLDTDFFAGRWESVTDRQRDLLFCVASLDNAADEFTIGEIVEASKNLDIREFTSGDVSQALPRLIDKGLIYKNRLGKYCFAVPLFSGFIRRRFSKEDPQKRLFD